MFQKRHFLPQGVATELCALGRSEQALREELRLPEPKNSTFWKLPELEARGDGRWAAERSPLPTPALETQWGAWLSRGCCMHHNDLRSCCPGHNVPGARPALPCPAHTSSCPKPAAPSQPLPAGSHQLEGKGRSKWGPHRPSALGCLPPKTSRSSFVAQNLLEQ